MELVAVPARHVPRCHLSEDLDRLVELAERLVTIGEIGERDLLEPRLRREHGERIDRRAVLADERRHLRDLLLEVEVARILRGLLLDLLQVVLELARPLVRVEDGDIDGIPLVVVVGIQDLGPLEERDPRVVVLLPDVEVGELLQDPRVAFPNFLEVALVHVDREIVELVLLVDLREDEAILRFVGIGDLAPHFHRVVLAAELVQEASFLGAEGVALGDRAGRRVDLIGLRAGVRLSHLFEEIEGGGEVVSRPREASRGADTNKARRDRPRESWRAPPRPLDRRRRRVGRPRDTWRRAPSRGVGRGE